VAGPKTTTNNNNQQFQITTLQKEDIPLAILNEAIGVDVVKDTLYDCLASTAN
jgi:hypothetical protein